MNIRQALISGSQLLNDFKLPGAELDAELLLSHAVSKDRTKLYGDHKLPLTDSQKKFYNDLLSRRASREPLAYLVGRKEFYGLPLTVNRHVLIPRPETETLVEIALKHATDFGKPRVIDVGTGSGAIALAVASQHKKARITAVDISANALDVARRNAKDLKTEQRITFRRSDLLSDAAGPFDLVLANLPYLTNEQIKDLPADIREFEPYHALAGGPDGLYWYERLLKQLPIVSQAGTVLLAEIGPNLKAGFEAVAKRHLPRATLVFHPDLAGRVRVAEVRL